MTVGNAARQSFPDGHGSGIALGARDRRVEWASRMRRDRDGKGQALPLSWRPHGGVDSRLDQVARWQEAGCGVKSTKEVVNWGSRPPAEPVQARKGICGRRAGGGSSVVGLSERDGALAAMQEPADGGVMKQELGTKTQTAEITVRIYQ